MTKIRVLIADDQPLVRQGIEALLALEVDITVVGQASDGNEAVQKILSLKPDVVLMDLRMPGLDGASATKRVKDLQPDIKVIVLTTFEDEQSIMSAMQAGASGYLLKDVSSEGLASAIRAVRQGYAQIGTSIIPKILQQIPNRKDDATVLDRFSTRELELVKLIASGRSNKEIASKLCLSEGTVKNYVSGILAELKLRDRTQIALWAKENLSDVR